MKRYRDERDDHLANEAILFGGLLTLFVLAIAFAAYQLITAL